MSFQHNGSGSGNGNGGASGKKRKLSSSHEGEDRGPAGLGGAKGELREVLRELGYPEDVLEGRGGGVWGKGKYGNRIRSNLFVDPHILIHCPPLSPSRPYPNLLAQNLLPLPSTSSSKPTARPKPSKESYPLLLPPQIASSPPYTFGRPTHTSSSHDPRYFLAYFPRLSGYITNRIITDLDSHPHSTQDQYQTQDLGGVVVLYTRPAASAKRTTFWYMWEIYGCWEVDDGVVDVKWLYKQREWVVESEQGNANANGENGKVNGNGNAHGNGNALADGENGMDIDDPDNSSKASPIDPTTSDSPNLPNLKFTKSPQHGPLPAVKAHPPISFGHPSGPNPLQAPTFVLLLADHRLQVYFSGRDPVVGYMNGNGNGGNPNGGGMMGLQMNLGLDGGGGGGFGYPRLEVLTCPLSSSSTVTLGQSGSNALGQGVQGGMGMPLNGLSAEKKRKRRLIQPGMGVIGLRKEDERIWVGYRSCRVRCGGGVAGGVGVDGGIVGSGGMMGDRPPDVMPPGGGVNGDTAVNGDAMDIVAEGAGVAGLGGIDGRKVDELLDGLGEEDWVEVVEVKFDCLGPVPSLMARPMPPIRFPPSVDQADLAGLAFINPSEITSPSSSTDAELDRDLGLLLVFNSHPSETSSLGPKSSAIKLVTYQISKRSVELSEAFAGLESPTLPAKKVDMSQYARTEWMSKVVSENALEDGHGRVEVLSCSESLSRDRILVAMSKGGLDPSTSVSWLDVRGGGLQRIAGSVPFVVDHVALSSRTATVAVTRSGSAVAKLSSASKYSSGSFGVGDAALVIGSALMNGQFPVDIISGISRFVEQNALDLLLGRVWKFCLSVPGHSPGDSIPNPVLTIDFLRIQHLFYALTSDERAGSALLLLNLVICLQVFAAAYTPVKVMSKGGPNGATRVPAYSTDSIWILLSYMKWHLSLMRTAIREAVLAAAGVPPNPGKPSALSLVINPASRRIMKDLNNHVHAFALFLSRRDLPIPLHRSAAVHGMDASSLQVSQLEIRGSLEAAGLSISTLLKTFDAIDALIQDEAPKITLNEWTESLFIQHSLPQGTDSIESKTVTLLSTDTQLLRQQSGLFHHDHTLQPIESETIDIITKEALPLSRQHAFEQQRELRQCLVCRSRSAVWLPKTEAVGLIIQGVIPTYPNTDGFETKWLEQWQMKCICAGTWQQVP